MTAAAEQLGGVGCVLRVECGLVEVLTDGGRVRVSLGGVLLARIAADRGARPEPGDWVRLTRWPDGAVTVDGTLGRARVVAPARGVVVPMRRRR